MISKNAIISRAKNTRRAGVQTLIAQQLIYKGMTPIKVKGILAQAESSAAFFKLFLQLSLLNS